MQKICKKLVRHFQIHEQVTKKTKQSINQEKKDKKNIYLIKETNN
mgnify:CR=1 FL=1